MVASILESANSVGVQPGVSALSR